MATYIKIEGLKETLARFDLKKFEPQVQTCFDNFGIRVEQAAKQLAPKDESRLAGAIFQQPGRLSSTIGCSVEYASFLEFGTRRYAAAYVSSLPADWQSYAATTKGKTGRGTMDDFIQAIMAWVQRKGIGAFKTKSGNVSQSASSHAAMQQAAYWIAINILQNGIQPHPYIYPAFEFYRPKLLAELNEIKL